MLSSKIFIEDSTVKKTEPVKNKKTNKSNVKDDVVDISDIKF
jgi:hypothetical protein